MDEEAQFVIAHTEESMKKSIAYLESELLKIRAGKANPQMLDSVFVEYYGVNTTLSQVANIGAIDAHTLAVKPWEKMMVGPVEKAILQANLGLNPQNDGEIIRIKIPALTEERRKDLVKQAKSEAEYSKVSIRNIRRDANEELKKLVKSGLAEDAGKDAESKVQDLTNSYIATIDEHMEVKEKEIMTI
ncbi:MAG: ribosome recycling factor [Bacteroidota bacterium]